MIHLALSVVLIHFGVLQLIPQALLLSTLANWNMNQSLLHSGIFHLPFSGVSYPAVSSHTCKHWYTAKDSSKGIFFGFFELPGGNLCNFLLSALYIYQSWLPHNSHLALSAHKFHQVLLRFFLLKGFGNSLWAVSWAQIGSNSFVSFFS